MASHSTRLRVHFEAGGAAGAARGLGGREGGVPKIGVEAPAADIVCLARDDVEEGRDHLVGLDEARSAATQLWLRNLQVRRLSKRVSKGLADAAARLRLVCEARRCPCDERLIERCARLQDPAVIDPRELPNVSLLSSLCARPCAEHLRRLAPIAPGIRGWPEQVRP